MCSIRAVTSRYLVVITLWYLRVGWQWGVGVEILEIQTRVAMWMLTFSNQGAT